MLDIDLPEEDTNPGMRSSVQGHQDASVGRTDAQRGAVNALAQAIRKLGDARHL